MNIEIIICTEKGRLEDKSALLVVSLRRYGGILSNCKIFSYAPRAGRLPSEKFLKFCEEFGVTVVDEVLNTDYVDYPLANKPIVCAYHEKRSTADYLLFMDSDTLIVNPLTQEDLFSVDFDVALNPVDYPNVATNISFSSGEATYWRRLYESLNIQARQTVRTTITKQDILQYYNSGFVLAKRSVKLFHHWFGNFRQVWKQEIYPEAGQFFVEQSVLSATIAQMSLQVGDLGSKINFPVRTYLKKWRGYYPLSLRLKKHLHYHKIFDEADKNIIHKKVNLLPHGTDLNAQIDYYLFKAPFQ
ncbi:MAG: hypothetical protein AAFO03_20675 [Bacteroidota bacterium]